MRSKNRKQESETLSNWSKTIPNCFGGLQEREATKPRKQQQMDK